MAYRGVALRAAGISEMGVVISRSDKVAESAKDQARLVPDPLLEIMWLEWDLNPRCTSWPTLYRQDVVSILQLRCLWHRASALFGLCALDN